MDFIKQTVSDFDPWPEAASFEKKISADLISNFAAVSDALGLMALSKAEMAKTINGNDEVALDIVERIATASKAFEELALIMRTAAERALCAAATTLE